jgi:hypothetical protein
MRLQRQLVLLISLAFAGPAALASDLLITGTIYTADESNPKVEAVVITDRVFTFAGSEALATAYGNRCPTNGSI